MQCLNVYNFIQLHISPLVQSVAGNSVECPRFKENLDSLWDKLKTKVRHLNPIDGDQIVNFTNYQVRST